MNATEQRRQAIDFTTIIYRVPTQLIARTGSGLLPTPESLKGKRVGVLQASIQETFAKAHWEPAGVAVVAYRDQNQRTRTSWPAVSTRRSCSHRPASAASCRVRTARASFVGQPVRDDKILGNGIAFGLRKGDSALKAKLDAAIDKLKADGTVKSLGLKYFGDIDISAK